jgi:triosephosphate isomerase (TIM)
MRSPLIAGNWKLNPVAARDAAGLLRGIRAAGLASDVAAVLPPFPYLILAREMLAGSGVALGAQDCSPHARGAHTGEVSAGQLADLGCSLVVVGHSERRAAGETDALVAAKLRSAQNAGLTAILCIGEERAVREAGRAKEHTLAQLARAVNDEVISASRLIVAYEPVWAIGTGLNATPADAQAMCAAIRAALTERFGAAGRDLTVQYGGSVNEKNAAELLAQPDIDGALVGGASLEAETFAAIVRALPRRV